MSTLPPGLRDAIVASGYFPEFVAATVDVALDGEEVVDSVVHHEATFTSTELHRHVTVLVLTPTRLIVAHTDDGNHPTTTEALTTVETVGLRHVRSVALTQVAAEPEKFGKGAGAVSETWLVVGWGAVRRQEVEPAACSDPSCEADHGWTSQDLPDDLTVRMSVAADGADAVQRLIRFGTRLQRVAI